MGDVERLIADEAKHSERHRDDPIPEGARGTRPNRARSVMFSVRLNPDELAAVQALAAELDVPASALVRGWIVQRVEAERNAPTEATAAIDRLEADVRALRKLVGS